MPDPEPSASDEAETAKTVILTEKDARDAARLFRLMTEGSPWADLIASARDNSGSSSAEPAAGGELVSRAKSILHMRRLRARHFNRVMFAETAWDILLILYLAHAFEARQTIGHVAELVETPLTTVLRWVGYLEKEHLVERQDHPTDRRIVFIRLTDKGRGSMESFLEEMPG